MASVQNKNLFALLDSSDDEDAPKKQAPKTGNAKANAPPPAPAAGAKKPAAATKPTILEPSKVTKGPHQGGERGERRHGAGPKGPRGPRADGAAPAPSTEGASTDFRAGAPRPPRQEGERKPRGDRPPRQEGDRPPRQEGDRPPRQEGDRPPRTDRPPRAEGERRAPRREFDRRSGTGRDRAPKKEGGGGHNWGSDQAEAATATPEVVEGEVAAELAEGAAEEAAAEEPVVPREPEPVVFTLDEFRAKQAAARTEGEMFAALTLRTVDESEFADLQVRSTEEEVVEEFVGGAAKSKRTKDRKVKNLLTDVGFRAPPVERGGDREDRPRRDGGDREGGRGGGRGGRGGDRREGGRGGGRGGRGGRAPNVTDNRDFPTLA